ncbi:hypothetical protein [Bacillus altitudinis]|uniref:hypothetical protein n=1 Tax=Bacillus altitudinis TaxID=293387 RepID=UPI002E1CC29A|nr:hypothetical protein [Bacillus altitudinis]
MSFPKRIASIARYFLIALLFFIILIASGGSLYRLFTHESIVIRHISVNSLGFALIVLALYCCIRLLKWSINAKEGENEKEKE